MSKVVAFEVETSEGRKLRATAFLKDLTILERDNEEVEISEQEIRTSAFYVEDIYGV